MKATPAVLRRDPGYRAEGLEWIRADLSPPVRYIHAQGQDWPQLWTTVQELPAPGSGGAATTTYPFSVAAGADDQEVQKNGGSYPPPGSVLRSTADTTAYAERTSTGSYYIRNILLRFDTSPIPDAAAVSAATLRLYVVKVTNQNIRSLRGEYYAWSGSLDTDYEADATAGTTAFEPVALASITGYSDHDFPLTNLSFVSKTGYTSVRLHVTGGQPAGTNAVQIATYEHTNYAEARLIVTYA